MRVLTDDSARLGIDVGGTFTDFVLADPRSNQLITHKEPSTPDDPSLAVEQGLASLLDQSAFSPDNIALVVHGTTLGLNTILQQRGVETALIVSRGNKDLLELGRCRMPSPYNFLAPRSEPLVSRDRVLEISARNTVDGEVIDEPSTREFDDLAEAIRLTNVKSVAVTLINSYVDPTLELAVAAEIAKRLPDVHVTPSTRVWPEIREYERAMLAVMNAYIHPLLDSYYRRLEERLRGLGLKADLYITASNGGTLSIQSARERPVDTLLSGPASGVVAACALSADVGHDDLVAIDMGGTSCDMSVTRGNQPMLTTSAKLGDFPIISPVIDVSAIGAGGGSIVWLDSENVLKVGPGSAGADPGPVAYGRGGDQPTVTDCFVATGLIAPQSFLGGRMTLDRSGALEALAVLGAGLGFHDADCAQQVADSALRVTTAMMAAQLYKELAQRGVDPRGRYLIAFGGAGPTMAVPLAEEAKLGGVLIPLSPGTLCAFGAIQSRVRRDFVRSVRHTLDSSDSIVEEIEKKLTAMESEALEWVDKEGNGLSQPIITRRADMRYAGQAYNLEVGLPDVAGERASAAIAESFHLAHSLAYGFPDRESAVEVINLRVSVVRNLPEFETPSIERATGDAVATGSREIFLNGATCSASIYERSTLRAGHQIVGPTIIEQPDTTVWIPDNWTGYVRDCGTLQLDRVILG